MRLHPTDAPSRHPGGVAVNTLKAAQTGAGSTGHRSVPPVDQGSAAIVVIAVAVAWTLALTLVVGPVTRQLADAQHAQSAADAAALAAVAEDCGAANRLAAANEARLLACDRRVAPGGIGYIAVVSVESGQAEATARASNGP